MLLCKECGKTIADSGYEKVHYGICASCPLPSEERKEDNSELLFDLETIREVVDIVIGDDGFRSKEVIEILKMEKANATKIIKAPYHSSCYDHGQDKEYTKFYRRTYTVADSIIDINSKSWRRDIVSWLIRRAFDKYETRETDGDPLEQLNNEFDWVK